MLIREKEDKIFEKWAVIRTSFISDGLIDESEYFNSNIKLLFVHREANVSKNENWDLREFLKLGVSTKTWDNITRWTIGLRNLDKKLNWSELESITSKQRKKVLKSICSINLKKSCDEIFTDNNKLLEIVNQEREYLNEQFSLYSPDIIICCGFITCEIFKSQIRFKRKLNWYMTDRGIYYCEYEPGKLLISYCHPEAQVQDSIMYYGLIDAVKEALLNMVFC